MGQKQFWYKAMVALSTELTQTPPQPILLSRANLRAKVPTALGNNSAVGTQNPLTEEEYLELEAALAEERSDYFHLGYTCY